jgi:pimeloyl-ACP methyl ester carboxylesterase
VPPRAFRWTIRAARAGLLALAAPRLMRDVGRARRAVFGSGYENVEHLSDAMVERFLGPVIGTRERARAFQRLLVSLRPDDLLAIEADLARLDVPTLVVWGTGDVFFDVKWAYWLADLVPGVTRVVELDGARLFFPDERASELAALLADHWAEIDART